jgi:hypothetical protein
MSELLPEKLRDAIDKFRESVSVSQKTNRDKWSDFAFKAGHMWTSQERNALEKGNPPRPAYVWNMIEPCVKLAVGTIIQNPFKVIPEPREASDQLLCDIMEEAIEFIDDRIGAEKEEIEAFDDGATCGAGYIDVDVMADPERPTEILMSETEVPFYEVSIDPSSRRDDWKDARWVFREKWLSTEDFKINYPEHAGDIEDIMKSEKIAFPFLDEVDTHDIDGIAVDDPDDSDYERQVDPDFYNIDKQLIRVIRMQYWDNYKRYYGFNPVTRQVEEFPEEKLGALKEKIPNFDYTTLWDKKVKWLEFTGDRILFDNDSPIPVDGFSLVPFFWTKDKSGKSVDYYGIVRALKDPNREVNKRWCQALNSLVSQGQGVMAEIGAFVDPRQAEESWSDPTQITWMKEGALSQGKVQEKPAIIFPDACMKMEALSQDAIKTISGLNPNLMGEVGNKQESGVVIRLRIQQGLVMLARAFDNFKKMRFEIYRRKLLTIMKYMPEEQLLRIIGNNDKYRIENGMVFDDKHGLQTDIRNFKDLKYNIKIEDSPGNITKTMSELAIFMEMLKLGFPVNPETVIEKLDLSAGDKMDWMEFITQKNEQGKKMKDMETQLEAMKEQAKAVIEQSRLEVKKEENAQDYAVGMAKLSQAERLAAQQIVADFINQRGQEMARQQDAERQAMQQLPMGGQQPQPQQQRQGVVQ